MAKEFSYECRFTSKYSACIDSHASMDNQVLIEHLIAIGVLLDSGNLVDLDYYYLYILPSSIKNLAWEENISANNKRLRFEAKRNNTYHAHLYSVIDDTNQTSQATGRYIGLYIRTNIDSAVSYLLTRQSKVTETEDIHSSILDELRKTNELLTTLTLSGVELRSNILDSTDKIALQEARLSDVQQEEDNSKDESTDPMARIEEFDFETLNV